MPYSLFYAALPSPSETYTAFHHQHTTNVSTSSLTFQPATISRQEAPAPGPLPKPTSCYCSANAAKLLCCVDGCITWHPNSNEINSRVSTLRACLLMSRAGLSPAPSFHLAGSASCAKSLMQSLSCQAPCRLLCYRSCSNCCRSIFWCSSYWCYSRRSGRRPSTVGQRVFAIALTHSFATSKKVQPLFGLLQNHACLPALIFESFLCNMRTFVQLIPQWAVPFQSTNTVEEK